MPHGRRDGLSWRLHSLWLAMIEAPLQQEPTVANEPSTRRRLRFSVLNLALVLTIAALGVGLYRAGQEVVPLREALRGLREEMGYFHVDDESRFHVKQVSTKLPGAWKWRLFLPEGRTYSLRCFCGAAPAPESMGREEWFQLLREATRDTGDMLNAGEFGFEALLTKYDGVWYLRTGRVQDDGVTLALPENTSWLNDETTWVVSSDASLERAAAFDTDSSVVLLHLEPAATGENGPTLPAVDADAGRPRIVIWIESSYEYAGAPPAQIQRRRRPNRQL
jgi:hypothetical protein